VRQQDALHSRPQPTRSNTSTSTSTNTSAELCVWLEDRAISSRLSTRACVLV
jgi:hypothetical protein